MRLTITINDDDYERFLRISVETKVSMSKLIAQYASERLVLEDGGNIAYENLVDNLEALEQRVSGKLNKMESMIGGVANRLQFLTDLTGTQLRVLLARSGPDKAENNPEYAATIEREFWRIFTHTVKNAGWTREASTDIHDELSKEDANHAE